MRKQPQEQPRALVSDVVQRGRPEPTGHAVINLKKPFLQRHPYAVTGSTVLLGLLGFFVSGYFSQASSVSFYPETCLGSWDDVSKAEGKPDAKTVEEIGPHNAALLERKSRDIYCGSFTGEIPEGASLKTLTLKLSWAVSDERLKAPKVVVPVEEGGESSASQEIPGGALDAQNPNSAEFELQPVLEEQQQGDGGGGDQAPAEEGPAEEAAQEETQPAEDVAPAPEPAPEEAPSSWLFSLVFAQEVGGEPVAPPAESLEPAELPSDPVPAPEPEPEPQLEPEEQPASQEEAGSGADPEVSQGEGGEVLAEPAGAEVATGTAEVAPEQDSFLSIEYSLDGVEWKPIKGVTRSNWQESVLIPVGTWEEIEKLQVRIERKAELDDVPYVYLDAMELVAEYDPAEGMATPDFDKDVPVLVRTNTGFAAVQVIQHADNRHVLWLYERTENPQWSVIATEDTMAPGSPVALRGSFIFWLSPDQRAITGFNAATRSTFSQSIVSIAGQPLWLRFDNDQQEVRYGGSFIFVDVATGEQYTSDDDVEFSTGFWELAKLSALQASSTASTTPALASSTASTTLELGGDGEAPAGEGAPPAAEPEAPAPQPEPEAPAPDPAEVAQPAPSETP